MCRILPFNMRYRNVTISGLPGAGSTTLGKLLAKELGWDFYSGGDFMRKYAIENGYFDPKNSTHHAATVYPDDFDRKVDYGLREKLQKESGRVYESWLSGFLAQNVEGVMKVLVYCSEDAIRVDRIANRDGVTIPEAKEHIFGREKENLGKWQRMYRKEWEEWVVGKGTVPQGEPIYFWRPELYDLAIDTFKMSSEEALQVVVDYFEEKG